MDNQPIVQSQLPAKKKQNRLIPWVASILIALAVVPWSVEKYLSPPQLGRNEQAYQLLTVALEEGRFSVVKENAIVAYTQTDDPDLSKVSQFFKDLATVSMDAGIDTLPESNTFKGGLKMFLAGYQHPLKMLSLTWDMLFITSKCERVDARYEPIIYSYREKQQEAKTTGRIVFWCIIVSGVICLLWLSKSNNAIG